MAFKKTSAAKSKSTSSAPKKGVQNGRYNVLKLGTSALNPGDKNSKVAYKISFSIGDTPYDEESKNYSKEEAILKLFSGLISTKTGNRRGLTMYFFNSKSEEENAPKYEGSLRFDTKINQADLSAETINAEAIKRSITKLLSMPDVFELEEYVRFSQVFLDEGTDKYKFKARALFYTKDYEVEGVEDEDTGETLTFTVADLAALASARAFSSPIYGALFDNAKGTSGGFSLLLDKELYTSLCNLADALGVQDKQVEETNEEEESEQREYAFDEEADEDYEEFAPY